MRVTEVFLVVSFGNAFPPSRALNGPRAWLIRCALFKTAKLFAMTRRYDAQCIDEGIVSLHAKGETRG